MFPHFSPLCKRFWILLHLITILAWIMAACAPAGPSVATTVPQPNTTVTTAPQPNPTDIPVPAPTMPPSFGSTTFFVLPRFATGNNPVVLGVAPLNYSPTENNEPLFSGSGVVIGFLGSNRDLPISDPQIPKIPAGSYWVMVRNKLMVFIDAKDPTKEIATSLAADIRTMERKVDPPEAIITVKDLCFSWLFTQVCTEPSAVKALSDDERQKIKTEMDNVVAKLSDVGLIKPEEINIEGTIPDMVGDEAVKLQEAGLLAAPIANFPSDPNAWPQKGDLLGVFDVLLPIHVEGYTDLEPGFYAVWADSLGENEWIGKFVRSDNVTVEVTGYHFQARAGIEEPMAILVGIQIGICWFENCRKR